MLETLQMRRRTLRAFVRDDPSTSRSRRAPRRRQSGSALRSVVSSASGKLHVTFHLRRDGLTVSPSSSMWSRRKRFSRVDELHNPSLESAALGGHVLGEVRLGTVRQRMIRSAQADVALFEKLGFPARIFDVPSERADAKSGILGHEGELLRRAEPLLVFPARSERGSQ
jgi:hypothetical protein